MVYHALVVDDNQDVIEDVQDRLECLGHTHDSANCMSCAREHLANNRYSYILLDLQIPVRYGRKSRVANGQNLLREIRTMKGYEKIPIIVMTTHGLNSPDLAVEVLRGDGASDFVRKPFPDRGPTLEKAIHETLAASGQMHPGARSHWGPASQKPPQPFESGEMVFYPSRVELCGVKICGGPESGMIRRILDRLRMTNQHGGQVRYDGDELAKRIGCERGQNGVAEAVAALRTYVCKAMFEEANIKVNRLHDIILNDRRYGYHLSPKITVRDADVLENDPQSNNNVPLKVLVNDFDDLEINDRQRWAVEQMRQKNEFRKAELVEKFRCAAKTAERDLRELRRRGLIEFIGPAKTGYWRLID